MTQSVHVRQAAEVHSLSSRMAGFSVSSLLEMHKDLERVLPTLCNRLLLHIRIPINESVASLVSLLISEREWKTTLH